ncbi:MAG: type II secretion system F family protein [Raoultibacter sp.]
MMSLLGALLITASITLGIAAFLYKRRIEVAWRDHEYARLKTSSPTTSAPQAQKRTKADSSLESYLLRGGIPLSPTRFALAVTLLCSVAGIGLALISAHPFGLAVGFLIVGGIMILLIKHRISQRSRTFDRQLAATLPMVAENMRGGSTVESAFATVAEYIDDPLHTELTHTAFDVMTANMTLPVALDHLAARMHNPAVELLSTTVAIQKTGGGNLADILDSLAATIAKRLEMRGHLEAITSSARLSAAIVSAMPPALLGLLSFASPAYMADFWASPYWGPIIGVVFVLDATGLIVISRMHVLDHNEETL